MDYELIKRTKQKTVCRDIVKEILDFGVDEFQKEFIIYLLAMELEDNDLMRKIASVINDDEVNSSTISTPERKKLIVDPKEMK